MQWELHDTKKIWAIPPSRVTAPYCHYKTSLLEEKMQSFGRKRRLSTRTSEIFHGNIQIYSSICLLLCSWSIRRQMSKGLLLDIQGNGRGTFLTSKQERVLNKKILHCTTSTEIPVLFSCFPFLDRILFYVCLVRKNNFTVCHISFQII